MGNGQRAMIIAEVLQSEIGKDYTKEGVDEWIEAILGSGVELKTVVVMCSGGFSPLGEALASRFMEWVVSAIAPWTGFNREIRDHYASYRRLWDRHYKTSTEG